MSTLWTSTFTNTKFIQLGVDELENWMEEKLVQDGWQCVKISEIPVPSESRYVDVVVYAKNFKV